MINTAQTPSLEKQLREALELCPSYWELRKQLAHYLYNQESFAEAADVIWEADELPSIDMELAFAARILAKAAPRKSIRLLSGLLEHNHGKAAQNLGMANALLHHGMVLQAMRFYGAALEADPSLSNPDLEHFMLWIDDRETLWGDFKNEKPQLGELPWMKRDSQEAADLTRSVSRHTTPIRLPGLHATPGEQLTNPLYQQAAALGASPTPPPAVTIPMDRVEPQHRHFDDKHGAPGHPLATLHDAPVPQLVARSRNKKSKPAIVVTPAPRVKETHAPAIDGVPISHGRKLQFPAPSKGIIRMKGPLPPMSKGAA